VINTISSKTTNSTRAQRGSVFFDLSSREKKKIIKQAVQESNELQNSLLREYSLQFEKAHK
jgi:hypothetical protein